MQLTHLMGAGVALAALGWLLSAHEAVNPPVAPVAPLAPPPAPPVPNGHYVLVVEGDRDQLNITHASAKPAPWAGVPVGFTSDWTLTIRDARGELLAEVPLDVTSFATSALEKGQPLQVQGCIVRDSHIAMLVNVPRFDEAASYTFVRSTGRADQTALGTTPGDRVRELVGGGR
ncbi:MAG: hypothetical protein ABIP94_16945 [Planctomycetota bacterium]